MKWDHKKQKWIARSWAERVINKDHETLLQGSVKDTTFKFGEYVFDNTEFKRSPFEVETMDVFDIFDFIEKENERFKSFRNVRTRTGKKEPQIIFNHHISIHCRMHKFQKSKGRSWNACCRRNRHCTCFHFFPSHC